MFLGGTIFFKRVVAIEMASAAQALDLRPQDLIRGRGTEAAYRCIRRRLDLVESDRSLSGGLEQIAELVHSGEILTAVASESGVSAKDFFR